MPGIRYTCNGPRKLDADGNLVLDDKGFSVRVPCGNDVTPEIEAVPSDGEDHIATCPVCGTEISVKKVPVAEVEAG